MVAAFGTIGTMSETPVACFARWWATRLDRVRSCACGQLPYEWRTPCLEKVTRRESRAAGYGACCNAEHASKAQTEALM